MTTASAPCISANAPGKVMLFGEYGVLEDGPAVLMAVNRQAQVKLFKSAHYQVQAPGYLAAPAFFDMQPEGKGLKVSWHQPENYRRLALLQTVCEKLPGEVPDQPLHFQLDTQALFDGQNKLGLGSSAALSVALAGAWARALQRDIALADCQTLHRHFQGGGSGADVAACYTGGIIAFHPNQPPQPASIPKGVHLAFIWTGISASTVAMLDQLRLYQQTHAKIYARLMLGLSDQANAVLAESTHLDGWFAALDAFIKQLTDFAKATGLPIFQSPHAELMQLASTQQVLYKPVGAGGGDLGLAVAKTAAALQAFCAQAVALGLKALPLEMATAGLQVEGALAC